MILGRFLLLLLLACDWWGDPHQGRSLFSGPLSSQQAIHGASETCANPSAPNSPGSWQIHSPLARPTVLCP